MPEPSASDVNCFGCAPGNPIGLRLAFEYGEDTVSATVNLGADYESFPGIVHGGIVAAILDELLAQAVYHFGGRSAFTTGLRIRYGRTMETDTDHVVHAAITRREDTTVRAAGRILLADGSLVAAAEGTFHLPDNHPFRAFDRVPPAELASQRS